MATEKNADLLAPKGTGLRFNINFYKPLWFFVFFSIALTAGSLFVVFTKGFNWGTDFVGGLELTVTFGKATTVSDLETFFTAKNSRVEIQPVYTKPNRFYLRAPETKGKDVGAEIRNLISGGLADRAPVFEATRVVSGTVSSETRKQALMVTLIALLAIGIYIAFRFKAHFAIGAIIAVIHDLVIMLGFQSAFHVEFGLLTVSALLTILGYSVNDTIVLFDRVREHLRGKHFSTFPDLINRSINDVFMRTIIMTATTMSVVVVLYFNSTGALKDFALSLIVGMISGTYSSIYIAAAYMVIVDKRKSQL